MATAFEQVTREALQLPGHQRLALAGLLLELVDAGGDPEAEAAWEDEIRARIQAVDDGTAVGIPYDYIPHLKQTEPTRSDTPAVGWESG